MKRFDLRGVAGFGEGSGVASGRLVAGHAPAVAAAEIAEGVSVHVHGLPREVVSTVAMACLAATAASSLLALLAAISLTEPAERIKQQLIVAAVSSSVNVASQLRTLDIRQKLNYAGYTAASSGLISGNRYAFWSTSITLQSLLVVMLRGPLPGGSTAIFLVGSVESSAMVWFVPLLTFTSIVAGGLASSLVPAALSRIFSCPAPAPPHSQRKTAGEDDVAMERVAQVALASLALACMLLASVLGSIAYAMIDERPEKGSRTTEEYEFALFQASTWVVVPVISVAGATCGLLFQALRLNGVVVCTTAPSGEEMEVNVDTFAVQCIKCSMTVLTSLARRISAEAAEDEHPLCHRSTHAPTGRPAEETVCGAQLLDIVAQVCDVVVHGGASMGAVVLAIGL